MDIIEDVLRSSSVFKDETTLFGGFVPQQLPHRKNEISAVVQNFRHLFRSETVAYSGGVTSNMAIIGSAGIGKTATAQFTVRSITQLAKREKANIIGDYKNCWNSRTRTAILRGLLRDTFGVSVRGLGSDEAVDLLVRRLITENAYLILILDEISVLSESDLNGFLHLTEEFGGRGRISLLLISRPNEWNAMLSPEISQRISDVLHLKPYSKEEMEKILSYRVSLSFKDTAISPDIIEMVSEICTNTKNLRHGLEILHRSGRIADRQCIQEITPEIVREAKNSVYPELRAEILRELKQHELLSLMGIARRLLSKNFTATTIREAYRHYKIACESYAIEPNQDPSFRRYLNTLERFGIIGIVVSKAGHGKTGLRARITIHDVPAAILIERIDVELKNMESFEG